MNVPAGALLIAAGLLFCLAGARLVRIFAFVAGGIAGFDAGMALMSWAGAGGFMFWAGAALVSIVAALAALLLLGLGMAAAGFGAGWMICRAFVPEPAACLVAAAAGAILCGLFSRVVLSILTAAAGAASAAAGASIILRGMSIPYSGFVPVLAGVILFAAGAAFQIRRR